MIPQPIDQVPLFLRLTEQEREQLTSQLRHHTHNANDLIFAAGKPSEMLCVIVSGWVKLENETPNGPILLANLGAGNILGEVDCLLKRPYSANARAGSAVDLLTLARSDLEGLILEHPTIGIKFSAALGTRIAYLDDYLITQRLAMHPFFSGLVETDLRALASKLEFRSVGRGEALFEAGAPGLAAFLIETGQARLITATHAGEEYAEVGEGELIGQQALVTGKPYAATAFSISELECWKLDRDAYLSLISESPAIKLAFSRALSEKLSPQEQADAVDRLRSQPLFADSDQASLQDLAGHLVMRQYPSGEWIYAEGTPGDALYVVESGEVHLFSDMTGLQLVGQKVPGETFGEMALLTGRTRGEAARTTADTTLWVLYRNDYDQVLVQHPELSVAQSRALSQRLTASQSDFASKHLEGIKLLQGLSSEALAQVALMVKPAKYRTGEVICFAGEPPKSLFLVESGQARSIVNSSNGQATTLENFGPGDSFGEAGVVQHTGQNVTIQALSDVDLLALSEADFDKLMGQYPTLALNVTRRIAEQAQRATERIAAAGLVQRAGAPAPFTPTRPPVPGGRIPAPPGWQRTSPPVPLPRPVPSAADAAPKPATRTPAPVQRPSGNGHTSSMNPNPAPQPVVRPAPGVRTVPARPWDSRGGTVVRPLPAATARPVQIRQPQDEVYGPAPTSATGNLATWFGSLNSGMKVQLAIIGVLIAILVCVVVPITVLSVATNVGAFFAQPTPSNDLPMNTAPGNQQQGKSLGGLFKIAQRETPTPTAIPPTKVPPTATRVPPTPTKKPVVLAPTKAPSADLAPKIDPAAAAAAAAAAAPKAPPLPPVQWDPRLGPGGLALLQGIHIEKAQVSSGQKFWMITRVKYEDAGAESGNDHTIYVTIVDEQGRRIDDATATVTWDEAGGTQSKRLGFTDQKPAGDYCECNYNWPMYGAGYNVTVDSLPSDKIVGMIMPMHRHVNYRITFQRLVNP